MTFSGGRRQPQPLPVLLVQQGQKAGEAAHEHGQPRRSDRMHQLSLAQILSYFRQNVEQKACAHATQNHLLHAAEAEEELAESTEDEPAASDEEDSDEESDDDDESDEDKEAAANAATLLQLKTDALARFATDQGVTSVRRVPRSVLDQRAHGVAHQGVAALAPELALVELETLARDPALAAIALDGIEDPQNFGAVVRSAVALGGAAVVFGEHSAAPLTPATFRASAGAVEHARLCRVRSLTGPPSSARFMR